MSLYIANMLRDVVNEALARYDVPSDIYERDVLIDAACVCAADKAARQCAIAAAIRARTDADALAALEAVKQEAVDTSAARDVLAERKRQVSQEGWTPEHDDGHSTGEIARAAACYALIGGTRDRSLWRGDIPNFWPWDAKWWKPKNRRRDLVKAAALILAEIERIDRAAAIRTTEAQEEG